MGGRDGHILELVGDEVEPGGEPLQIFEVLIGAGDALGELLRRCLGGWIEEALPSQCPTG